MPNLYDRTAAGVPASTVRSIKDQLNLVRASLKDLEEYLYEDATPAAMAKALGYLATAERYTSKLREKIEKAR